MSYEPLHHKYRPQTFAELVGQEAIAATLTNALQQQKIAPAYLFTGARGTGKTSSARILAKSLNCVETTVPTAQPCGVCEVCRSIANGSALDVIEIDAASNTGVDNIRELIERAQFAPVQCRYKVYVVDECLTGDSLVSTDQGLCRIDDPKIQGKRVLSYNERSEQWEFKPVVRWLDQGEKETLVIQTTHRKIRCTANHLIRTETGWVAAGSVKEGMRILSPANVVAAQPFTNTAQTDAYANSIEGISLREILTAKGNTAWTRFCNKLNLFVPCVPVGVEPDSMFLPSCSIKELVSKKFDRIGTPTLTRKGMAIGTREQKNFWQMPNHWMQKFWDLFTAPCWEMAVSAIPTSTAVSLDWRGLIVNNNAHGWNTRLLTFKPYDLRSRLLPMPGMEQGQLFAELPAILSSKQFFQQLDWGAIEKLFPKSGLGKFLWRDWHGGIWTMALLALAHKVAPKFNSIRKGILEPRMSFWQSGLQTWGIQPRLNPIVDREQANATPTCGWEPTPAANGWQSYSLTPSRQWITNLETVISVSPGGVERVYDIEVEENHNFVANGLLVHNCHMLSTAAFNALLKTLEEPPDRVVFVLATTDPQRVLPTIISRCQRFDFRRIPLEAMVQHLGRIASQEAIDIIPEAVQLVGQISQGGLRDAESLLDQLSLLPGQITPEKVWDLVGAVPERELLALVQAIAANDATAVLDRARRLMDRGREPLIVLQNLASFYRDLLIAKTSPDRLDLVAITPPTWAEMSEFAQTLDIGIILAGQQHLRASEVQVKNTTQPRLWLEVTLLGLLPSAIVTQGVGVKQPVVPSTGAIPQSTRPQSATPQPTRSQSTPPQSAATTVPPAQTAGSAQSNGHKAPISISPSTSSQSPSIADPPLETAAPAVKVPAEPPPPKPIKAEIEVSEPLSEVLPEPVAPDYDLHQVWEAMLAHLKFPGTQALMRQQGHLLAFNGHEARIGIKSQPLIQMAKKQLPNLEAAFEAVYQCPVRISLEVMTAAEVEARSADPKPQIPVPASPPAKPIVREATPANGAAPSSGSSSPSYSVPAPPVPSTPLPVEAIEPPIPVAPSWQAEDEVRGAAKSLAQFFNGQIVTVDGEDLQVTTSVGEVALTPGQTDLAEGTDLDDDDDDVPF